MKIFNSTVNFLFFLIVSIISTGCSTDKTGDLRELLEAIPSDVSFVGVIDSEELLKQAGFKVKNGTVTPGKDIARFLDNTTNTGLKSISEMICDGGIDPSYITVFTEGYNSYLSGYLSDTDNFKSMIENRFGEKVTHDGELSICGNIAFTSNRFWCCLNSRNNININDVKHFNSLSEKQSFTSLKVSGQLVESDKIMRGWGDIKGCLNASGLDFSTKASIQMGLEALFEDAVEFVWDMDIDKDELEMDLSILNKKGGIAAFLYPVEKTDAEQIRTSGIYGDAILAIAISPKFTERMREDTRGKGMSVAGMFSGMISDVSGTVIIGADNANNIDGLIPVKGTRTSDLNQLLSQYDFSVTQENGAIRFSKGKTYGNISPDIAAKILKGKTGGLIISPDSLTGGKIDYVAFTLTPEKGGMEVNVEVKSKNKESLFAGLRNCLNLFSRNFESYF